MRAEILTIGSEILAGDVLDTNGRDLARALRDVGIAVGRRVSVPDDVPAIAGAVREALERAEVVIATGGLGPTSDDLTRNGVAQALGVNCVLREELVEPLRQRFRNLGYPDMPATNLVQLMLPEGAEPLPNPIGTAPGFRLLHGRTVLFAVPGIPREMQVLLDESILPWLRAHRPVGKIEVRLVRTIGIGESDLMDRFGDVFHSLSGVEIGFYPQLPGVDLKLTVRTESRAEGRELLAAAEARIRTALGSYVWGTDGDTLAKVVGEELAQRGWRVATAESCTGGRIAAELTSVPGSSRYFDRSVVAYSDRAKVELLGVPAGLLAEHGAVSEPVARAMAQGLRERSGVEVTLAASGIAGPTGGTVDKPVGTVWCALATPEDVQSWRWQLSGSRTMILTRTTNGMLNRLRRFLQGAEDAP